MILEFILLFERLNLALLPSKKSQEVIEKIGLMHIESVEIFEYRKNNNGYLDRAKLYQQVINKTLPIVKVFYFSYSLLFLFDNATSHLVYAKDALQVINMNKNTRGK